MTFRPYSFSKLSSYLSCPRQFKYLKIDKLDQGPVDRTALKKGSTIHHMLEVYPEASHYVDAWKYRPLVNTFINSNIGKNLFSGNSIREYNFGLDNNLEPTEYSNTALFRGSVDYICIVNNILHLVDFKTGKAKDLRFQTFDQLNFYAIYFFKKYKHIDEITISYVYVEHEDYENKLTLKREYLTVYENNLMSKISKLENDETFEKNITKLCDWCPFQQHCNNDVS